MNTPTTTEKPEATAYTIFQREPEGWERAFELVQAGYAPTFFSFRDTAEHCALARCKGGAA